MRSGYFEGADLRPLVGDDVRLPEGASAIVFIFAPEGPALDSLSKFNTWAASAPANVSRFAVASTTNQASRAAIEEVLFQRGIKVPVYLTQTDFLSGKNQRVLALVRGEAKELADLEPATLNAAAGSPTTETILPPAGIIKPADDAATQTLMTFATNMAAETTVPSETDLATSETKLADSSTTPVVRGAPYANDRYKFRIVFPEGWDYEEVSSGAGAKAIAPSSGMTTDMRAYAVRRATSRETPAGAAEGYFENFRERMGNRGLTDIEVTGRYELADREFVGREFEYKFTQPGPGEFSMDETRTGRGRIQIFASGGVFKVALVEGPAYEFKANETAANAFMETFHPY